MRVSAKEIRQEQKEIIKKFYKDFLSWKADNVGMWILAGMVEVIYGILMMIPLEELFKERQMFGILLLVGMLGPYLYLLPYIIFSEERKQYRIYEKIKYLPVDKKMVQQIRVEKLIRFVIKIFPIMAALHLGMSFLTMHRLTIWNFVYIICYGLIGPILMNLPIAWYEK